MSFEGLVKKISPKLRGITHRLDIHFTFFNDEDLFQEALIRLWQDFEQGKLTDKTDSYILQGCYFYLKNYLRKEKQRLRIVSLHTIVNEEGSTLEEVLFLSDELKEDRRAYFHNKFLADTIRNNGLTQREKTILGFCQEGLTFREIGLRLGVTHVAVVKSMSKIKEKCRRYLDTNI